MVKVGGFLSGGFLHEGNHAAGRIQEGQDEVAGNDPGQEVGEEHQSLVGLGHEPGGQLAHHNGEGHGDDQTQDDPQDVITQGVADHDAGVGGFEKLKVFQAHPFTLDDIVPESVGAEGPVVFKRDHNTEHGQVTDQQQPDGTGKHHGGQPEGLLPGSDTSVSNPALSGV